MTIAKLEFLRNHGGEAEGLGEAGIETFRGSPFVAVARETGQNSQDARLNKDTPVRITFDRLEMATKDFPSISDYKKVAKLCLEKSKTNKNKKELEFFKKAVSVLNAKVISILRISDFNTTGVAGPCKEGNPFHSLVKSDGVSDKATGSLGSFGIGKNAPFSISDIQTVFYSTLYPEKNSRDNLTQMCMGKTQFISHKDSNGYDRRRKGYWGVPETFMPITNDDQIPSWLKRTEQGTSIFSIAMRESPDWELEMTVAILINFFVAVHRNQMVFEINDSNTVINSGTLTDLFHRKDIEKVTDKLNKKETFNKARNLYYCLRDGTISELINVDDLGEFQMHILIKDNIGHTVGIVRNGMFISDNLSSFDEPFRRFPLYRNFATIIEPNNDQVSESIKWLENPKHDNISAERITDPVSRRAMQRNFKSLAKQIRTALKKYAKTEAIGQVEIDELSKFFQTDYAESDGDEGLTTHPMQTTAKRIEQVSDRTSTIDPNESKLDEDTRGNGTSSGGSGSSEGSDNEFRNSGRMEKVHLQNERIIVSKNISSNNRQIYFTPTVSELLVLELSMVGLSDSEKLVPRAVFPGEIVSGRIKVNCEAKKRVELLVEFDTEYNGPVELTAFREKKEIDV